MSDVWWYSILMLQANICSLIELPLMCVWDDMFHSNTLKIF